MRMLKKKTTKTRKKSHNFHMHTPTANSIHVLRASIANIDAHMNGMFFVENSISFYRIRVYSLIWRTTFAVVVIVVAVAVAAIAFIFIRFREFILLQNLLHKHNLWPWIKHLQAHNEKCFQCGLMWVSAIVCVRFAICTVHCAMHWMYQCGLLCLFCFCMWVWCVEYAFGCVQWA